MVDVAVTLRELSDEQLIGLLREQHGQVATAQARELATMAEVSRRTLAGLPTEVAEDREFVDGLAELEIGAALACTTRAAASQLDLAEDLIGRLPAVHQAMLDGRIDYPKALLLSRATYGLSDEQARAVADRVLPDAPRKTTGQLKARLGKLVIKADPKAATRQYKKGLRGRRLGHWRDHDGTAVLEGRGLPADRSMAAFGRVDAIARWFKDQDGETRTLEQLRADVALDLLQGLPVPGPDGQTDQPTPAPAAGADRPDRDRVCGTCGLDPTGRGSLELTAPLQTLLGLAEHPGELGSWGPILADAARDAIEHLMTAAWRFTATDHTGRVIWHGPIRRRPTTADANHVKARDRRCRFPGCRRPARRAQIDHTVEHQHGGPSIPPNLGVLCWRHHTVKTEGLWKLKQPDEGTFIWTSPLGQTYLIEPDNLNEDDDFGPINPGDDYDDEA
jgi:hypothetical protein